MYRTYFPFSLSFDASCYSADKLFYFCYSLRHFLNIFFSSFRLYHFSKHFRHFSIPSFHLFSLPFFALHYFVNCFLFSSFPFHLFLNTYTLSLSSFSLYIYVFIFILVVFFSIFCSYLSDFFSHLRSISLPFMSLTLFNIIK